MGEWRTRVCCVAAGLGLAVFVCPDTLAATWSYTDDKGVIHFTNIEPRAHVRHKWVRLPEPPSSQGDCRGCDRVPARDTSVGRYQRYDGFIAEASRVYRIPKALIRAIIEVESDYDPRVVSNKGARGLMQLMPSVIQDMGVQEVHDPRENILAGTRLLRILANRYEGDLVRTIAAYHAGVGNLTKYGDAVPPSPRTRRYVRLVLARYRDFSKKPRDLLVPQS